MLYFMAPAELTCVCCLCVTQGNSSGPCTCTGTMREGEESRALGLPALTLVPRSTRCPPWSFLWPCLREAVYFVGASGDQVSCLRESAFGERRDHHPGRVLLGTGTMWGKAARA